MKTLKKVATAAVIASVGLGLGGLCASTTAQAAPGPVADYHWCPGQRFDPRWGNNWDAGRCHDDHFVDGEARDQGHFHNGPFDPGFR